jgi:hypothetical protein
MRILAALLAAAAILAAGCGGSSNDTAATTATTAVTESEDMSTDTTSGGTETESAGTTPVDTNALDAIGSAAGLSEGCKQVAAMSLGFAQALAAAGATGSDDADLQKAADAYEAYADKVPEEIRDSFRTLAGAYAKYAKALQELDLKPGTTPDAATIAKLAAVAQELDDASVKAASDQISSWADENCKGSGG